MSCCAGSSASTSVLVTQSNSALRCVVLRRETSRARRSASAPASRAGSRRRHSRSSRAAATSPFAASCSNRRTMALSCVLAVPAPAATPSRAAPSPPSGNASRAAWSAARLAARAAAPFLPASRAFSGSWKCLCRSGLVSVGTFSSQAEIRRLNKVYSQAFPAKSDIFLTQALAVRPDWPYVAPRRTCLSTGPGLLGRRIRERLRVPPPGWLTACQTG